MFERTVSGIILTLLFASVLTVVFSFDLMILTVSARSQSSLPVHNNNTGLSYSTIQGAIDAAETLDGHTILVEAGTYYEYVSVYKSLTVIGENRTTTAIDGKVTVTANDVAISGFTIRNGYCGIAIKYCNNNNISCNNFLNNHDGIYMYYSSNNIICGNTVSNTTWAIYLRANCDNNNISGNTVSNTQSGIHVLYSNNNTISFNNVLNNTFRGIWFWMFVSNNTISFNNVSNNTGCGIYIDCACNNNTIYGNTVLNNTGGIHMDELCDDNTIYDNTVSNNNYGICQNLQSHCNTYHNDFINNTRQVWGTGGYSWDNGYPSGGNYWSDYTGVDFYSGPYQNITGSDGIGDTPYTINENNQDRYPLMEPLFGIHDIAVTNITPSKTVVGQGYSTSINVTVENQGDFTESFNVTVYYDETAITLPNGKNHTTITLTSGNSTTITITWNTTDIAKGNYTISAYATPVSGETDLKDNLYVDGTVRIVGNWTTGFIGLGGYPIVDFAVYDGKLYAAADSLLYAFDGTSWDVVAAPTYVTSLESYKDKLVVGGQGGLYYYDGTSFNLIFSVPTYIKVLGVYNTTLYAGTFLDKPPTLYYCNGSAENPSNWYIDTGFSSILNFSGPFGSINSFAVYNDKMYISSGGAVYSYNGTDWSIAKTYDAVYAYLDMKVYNGKLYLATRDQAWRKPYYQGYSGFSGRVIEFDGNNWTTVFDHDYWIYSLETYDGKLYAGTANKIYTYNGTDWNLSFNATEGAYYAVSLITFDGRIYAGIGNGYILEDPSPEVKNTETMMIPEFPLSFILILFMITTLLAVIIYRRKHTH